MKRINGNPMIIAVSLLVAVVLGIAGGVLASKSSGATATVIGAITAVLVAVAAGLASAAWWQLRLDRLARAARAEEIKTAGKLYELPGPAREGGVAHLLRPEGEIVPFWPRSELEVLIAWVNSPGQVAIQLVAGDGGTGKTRLARQLAKEVAESGWRTWWVPAGTEPEATGAARDAAEPVLLVVDYAETRAGLKDLVADVTSRATGPRMRLLLLARSPGEWWQQLIRGSEYSASELLAAIHPITLGPASDQSRQPEVFRQALAAFAGKLGLTCPDATMQLADPHATMLMIHAAALLTVLECSSAGPAAGVPTSGADVLAGLLRHEARYWQQSQAARGLSLDTDVARRAVAAGCLVGADDEASAIELLSAIADLADPAQRGKVARWLRDLYPVPRSAADDHEWIGPLQPDLIAEQLVVSVLAQQPGLIPALFKGLADRRAVRALTVLARAARNDPAAVNQLATALASDLADLAVPALDVAVETNPAVGSLVRDALTASMPSAEVLERIADALPYPSLALTETAVLVFRGLAAGSARDARQRGGWLDSLGNWLSDLGRPAEALAAAEQAVTIFRRLADEQPDTNLLGFAAVLNNHSNRLSALGRDEEALAAIEEAVTIYRRLADEQPDTNLPYLATLLDTMSGHLFRLGRREEALAAIEEAVGIYARQAVSERGANAPHFAAALNNQSNYLSQLGREEEALEAIEVAVTLYRWVAEEQPDANLPGFAVALLNQSGRLSALGRREEALVAIEDAVTIYRRLADEQPDTNQPGLAAALSRQSEYLSELGREEEASAANEEAVTLYRQWADDPSDQFLPDLATSLHKHAGYLTGLGQQEEARAALEETVVLYRRLAHSQPDRFVPGLGASLGNLAGRLAELGRQEEALAAIEEAAAIYQRLAHDHRDGYRAELATSRHRQAEYLAGLGREEDARPAIEEALTIYRQLADDHPDEYLPDLTKSLFQRADYLYKLGRADDAVAAMIDALKTSAVTFRRAARDDPDQYLPSVVTSLNSLADLLEATGREAEGAAARAEAAELGSGLRAGAGKPCQENPRRGVGSAPRSS